MPCASFSLPWLGACPTGRILAKVPNSVCSKCYAGKYRKVAVTLREENLAELEECLRTPTGRTEWVAMLTCLVRNTECKHFRWHDSGDIISYDHLKMICEVAKRTPRVKHWLPTREYKFCTKAYFDEIIPENLTVRLSAHMIGEVLPERGPFVTSSVNGTGYKCPASHSNRKSCQDCRACWSKSIRNVDYGKH
jgi:hypothetical protein